MREDIIEKIKTYKIIAIIRDIYGADRRKLMKALRDGGIRLAEFTFDQAKPENWHATQENIRETRQQFAGELSCGAGTVMDTKQLAMAKEAGAEFIISPDTNEAVIRETRKLGMVSIPGAFSPTEIAEASSFGADFVKIFPASVLGKEYFQSVKGPLKHIPLLAVGGVSFRNLEEYLEAGALGVGIGGELTNKKWLAAGDFDKLRETAEKTAKAARRHEWQE